MATLFQSTEPLLIQAPLAGYSCAPMRLLAEQWGQPLYCCTEMLSAQHIVSGAPLKKRFTYQAPQEGLLGYQLSGHKASVLAQACEIVQTWGTGLIDLNCGCPQPKIRKKGNGSRLLAEPEELYQIVRAMRTVSDVPLTVKIRVSGFVDDQCNEAVADAVQSAGADALIVHGRHWTETYDDAIHYRQIRAIVERLDIPVIANGDVVDSASAKHLLAETGAKGIMIARASLGQPWLFAEIRQGLCGKSFIKPTRSQVNDMLLQHAMGLIALEGEHQAMLQCRKLVKYYYRGEWADAHQLEAAKTLSSYHDLLALVQG